MTKPQKKTFSEELRERAEAVRKPALKIGLEAQ